MGLKDYESKRKFPETPEPEPGPPHKGKRLIFVVHKHAARALHYDLRLELEGVLKSWAVPKGPSLDPSVKRLAMMVEDHPFDYKDFEGVIPEGNYGAGSVIIWDKGYWRHPGDSSGEASEALLIEALKKGNLKFVLEGEKLRGEFALVKTGMGSKSWLLLKKKDVHATGANIAGDNRSVVSRRTLEDVAVSGEQGPPKQAKMDRMRREEAMEEGELADAPVATMPRHVRPMLATLIKEPFDDEEWIFEVKWDGYRAIAEIRDKKASLYSRNLISLDEKFAPIRDTLGRLTFEALLDGEIVVVDDEGYPDFQMLQDYRKSRKGHLIYYVFDLLHLGGHDLTNLPLIRRKELLRKVLPSLPGIRFTDHIWKDGIAFFNVVSEKGLEGIVAKNSRSVYRPGKRSLQWLKVKTRDTQDAVIGGFTEPGGLRKHFGALVLGVYEKDDLVYIGHTGGGFSAKSLTEIRGKLEPLIRRTCPFKIKPKTNRAVTWVEPELVCEVDFHGWTTDGVMRQPTFLRMRDDKSARDVMREKPPAGGEDMGKAS
ncbi:MAG: non-homologous end-joining DNA ligase [Syntrophorhabdaceae bacterium]|nr:non-homologous end-joining DNA ligase [Syntrophorhabdaceae bacterium]